MGKSMGKSMGFNEQSHGNIIAIEAWRSISECWDNGDQPYWKRSANVDNLPR